MSSPPLPGMLRSIVEAAATMFPDGEGRVVEEHVRRAWNSVAHEHGLAWEEVSEGARREWERLVAPRD